MKKDAFYWLVAIAALALGSGCGGATGGQGAVEPAETQVEQSAAAAADEDEGVTYRNIELRLVAAADDGDVTESWCGEEPAVLETEVVVDGSHIESLSRDTTPEGQDALMLQLDDEGRQRLADVTSANIDRRLAIVVDGRIVMSPVIREAITGGSAQITSCEGLSAQEMYDRITGGDAE